MQYVENAKLGRLSVMALGCWNFGAQWNKTTEDDAISIIREGVDCGINVVDTAESYGFPDGQCEMILGKALRDGYREKVFLISKVGWFGRREVNALSAKDTWSAKLGKRVFNKLYHFKTVDFQHRTPELIRLCGHACCGRLMTDHIDLLLCHDGNPQEMSSFIGGFRTLKKEGFIRNYGISTDSLPVLKRFYEESEGECAACECDYSLLNRSAEKGLFEYCQKHDIAIFTRGTLCRGLLSGKYDRNTIFKEQSRVQWNPDGRERWKYEKYMDVIDKIRVGFPGSSMVELAYGYAISQPSHPVVIFGCTNAGQLHENVRIADSRMLLNEDVFKKLQTLTK